MAAWRVDEIPAFCITLQRRPDRWKNFIDQPAMADLPNVKRFNGIDGRKLDIKNDSRIPLMTKRNILAKMRRTHEELDTAGGVGCALSHIAVWEWLRQNDAHIALVFEDDAKVPADFASRVNAMISRSPTFHDTSKWDMITFTEVVDGIKPISGDTHVRTIEAFVGLQCYIMTKHAAERILEHVYPVHMHIDLWLGVYNSVYSLRILNPTSVFVGQRSSKTDIQNNGSCKICDVPTGFEETHSLIGHGDLVIARAAEIIVVASAVYFAYQYFTKKQ